jgi:hypothetical protein
MMKFIKMTSWKAWVQRPSGLKRRALKVRVQKMLKETRDCFERLNICNQSKS